MQSFRLLAATVVIVVLADASRVSAAQIVYGFTPLASSASFGGLSPPSINNSGTVAFLANGGAYTVTANGTPHAAISNAGLTGEGAVSLSPSINDAGTVAATIGGYIDFGGSVVSSAGGGTTIAATPSPVGAPNFGLYGDNPAIRADGTVAFEFSHQGGISGEGVFAGSGGPIMTLYSDQTGGTMIDPSTSRSANVIAYAAPILNGSLDTGNALFINNGTSTTQVASAPNLYFNSVAVNAGGNVAASVSGAFESGGGVYEAQGGTLVTLVPGTEFVNSFGDVSINDSGTLAFYETTTNTSTVSGIYLWSGGSTSKVIATGDPLDGSTVTGISFGNEALNNSDQVAFFATLANGTSAEFLASPVPEPSSFLLLAVGILAIGALLRTHAPPRWTAM